MLEINIENAQRTFILMDFKAPVLSFILLWVIGRCENSEQYIALCQFW